MQTIKRMSLDAVDKFVQENHNVDDMKTEPCRLFAWFEVKYIFCPGDGYLHIELDGDAR